RLRDFEQFSREVFAQVIDPVPVIIACHNEQRSLPVTLTALARQEQAVLPIVVDNDSTDRSAEIADRFGARVLFEPRRGKMLALQRGILSVLDNPALSDRPLLFTDADTVMPAGWARHMAGQVSRRKDSMITGLRIFNRAEKPAQLAINGMRTAYVMGKNVKRSMTRQTPVAVGQNMALSPLDRGPLGDAILKLPNYWPCEDAAIRDEVLDNGGTVRLSYDRRSLTFTAGDRYGTVKAAGRRLLKGASCTVEQYDTLDTGAFVSRYDGKSRKRSNVGW
ncbi:MAG TPA: glycosyltransferase family A protein, partial [Candidatus Saccharimonadales bacterium]|nr:glycosyltransferase family A protein [Candidatus Saccharimonadales bacterium]